jgi:hypothetical protein
VQKAQEVRQGEQVAAGRRPCVTRMPLVLVLVHTSTEAGIGRTTREGTSSVVDTAAAAAGTGTPGTSAAEVQLSVPRVPIARIAERTPSSAAADSPSSVVADTVASVVPWWVPAEEHTLTPTPELAVVDDSDSAPAA